MFPDPVSSAMKDGRGQDVVERLGSRDLNDDGEIINPVSYTHLTLPTSDLV